MAVTLCQIAKWNEGDLLDSAVTSAKDTTNPLGEVDVFFMDGLAQKLRTALLTGQIHIGQFAPRTRPDFYHFGDVTEMVVRAATRLFLDQSKTGLHVGRAARGGH
jgi:hypothetical protein